MTDLKGLNNFQKKLQDLKKNNKAIKEQICKGIVEEGTNIAVDEYNGSRNVLISGNQANGIGQIKAQGKGVAYMEFGTGSVGEGTYPRDKLPTQTIEFESPNGSPQSTQGWVYNYENDKTKIKKNGVIVGWMIGNKFTKGRPAEMQMYSTSTLLRKRLQYIGNKAIKEVKKND